MSTLQATNLKHASSASNNIVLDSSGNATFAGTAVPASSFLRNRIINGDMRIDQRNAGASVTPASLAVTYTVDRWAFYVSAASKLTAQRSTVAPTGFTNSLLVTSSSAYTPGSSDLFNLFQSVEGFNVGDLGWGTANAQTITLSFWTRSSVTGTYSGAMSNSANNRFYLFNFTISAADTWEYKTVTIAGDTSGTWLTDNGIGVNVRFDMGAGSTYFGTAGSWSSSSTYKTSGSVNLVATSGATFYLTGVQLEVGSAATPFERRQYGQELALCQRYYNRDVLVAIGGGATPTATNRTFYCSVNWPVAMRAAPTMTLISTLASSNMNAGAWVNLTASRGRFSATNSVANDCALEAQYSADIEL